MNPHRSRPLGVLVGMFVLTGLAACGGDDTDDGAVSSPTTAVVITGVDYAFEDVPKAIPAGARLSFHNVSTKEVHELVVFPIPEGETAPAAELMARPPEELMPALGEPVTVLFQAPGTDAAITAGGDGVIAEPGRYLFVCFVPIGADPQEFLDAAAKAEDEPPEVAGGAPHFTAGMYAELTVT